MHSSRDETATEYASWAFIAIYALAYTGIWVALLTPVIVTIALRVSELAPADAPRQLATILSIGATCALLAGPLFGHLSDRTTSRFGMRKPWIVAGMLGGCVALSIVATAPTVTILLIGWCLAQFAFNAALAGIVALLADQIPSQQRGTVAGILGICMPLGQLIGAYLVQAAGSILLAFMLPAALGTVAVLALVATLRDRRLVTQPPPRERRAFRTELAAHRDFWCAWSSRLLLGIGTAFLTSYQPLFLIHTLQRPVSDVPALMFRSMLLQSLLVIAASLTFGRLSDRLRRRKPFVLLGAASYTLGLWWIASATSFESFLVGLALASVAHGMYFAVDLALVTDVLPDPRHDAAKDLGILNITNTLPQIVAPLAGAAILLVAQGSYATMYVIAGTIALLGAAALVPIRAR